MRPRFWNRPPMNTSSCAGPGPAMSDANDAASSARKNSPLSWLAWALFSMWSSSTKLMARLRMAENPIRLTARDTVLMCPAPTWLKCAEFTTRSSLLVSATSFRISLVKPFRLSVSDAARFCTRKICSDMAGKSLVRRMRRSKKSRVALVPLSVASSPLGTDRQACSASRRACAEAKRRSGSRASARSTTARSASSSGCWESCGRVRSSWATR